VSQKLLLPFQSQMMLCGYKNAEYKAYWKYAHYGIDVSSIQGGAGTDAHIYASGEGTVLAAGKDNTLGYGVAVLYPDCIGRDGGFLSLVARYMHLSALSVKEGDSVQAGDVLGVEGKEGTGDYHLHLEIDRDTTPQYAVWSPQVSKNHTFWVKGTDTTLNPTLWLWRGREQSLVAPTYNPAWLNSEDFEFPDAEENTTSAEEGMRDRLVALAKEILQEWEG
jgi:murein DD-endopeptidase MepM/ murein hydrolase activator NlpD